MKKGFTLQGSFSVQFQCCNLVVRVQWYFSASEEPRNWILCTPFTYPLCLGKWKCNIFLFEIPYRYTHIAPYFVNKANNALNSVYEVNQLYLQLSLNEEENENHLEDSSLKNVHHRTHGSDKVVHWSNVVNALLKLCAFL